MPKLPDVPIVAIAVRRDNANRRLPERGSRKATYVELGVRATGRGRLRPRN